jgi:hypothetical protein
MFHDIGMKKQDDETLPDATSYWLRRRGKETVSIVGRSERPVRKGFAVLAASDPDDVWDRDEVAVTLEFARRMAPKSTVLIAPVLGTPVEAPGDRREFRDRRPLTTTEAPDLKGWHRTEGGYQAEIDTISVALSTSVKPAEILLQAAWRAAEAFAMTDAELDAVAQCFLESKDAQGGIQHEHWSLRDLEAVCHDATVSDWAAELFMKWYGIWGLTGDVRTLRPMDKLFDKIASGKMGRRHRRKEPNLDPNAGYRARLRDLLDAIEDPEKGRLN